jgi:hypothetical protein
VETGPELLVPPRRGVRRPAPRTAPAPPPGGSARTKKTFAAAELHHRRAKGVAEAERQFWEICMTPLRALRRVVLTPNVSATKMDRRGFHVKSPESAELLETIGASFLAGYAHAAGARTPADAETELERVPTRFRGFAYEGAAMACAVRDTLPFGRHDHVARLLAGRGDAHRYMAYVGVGWAMARVPAARRRLLHAPDPLLRWLVLDGYGFHQAYFHTDRYVHRQFRPAEFPWPADDPHGYALRAVDQGIGRALWFVGGTDAAAVTRLIATFAPERRPDLYSGAGLAATYAGGATDDELRAFARDAGPHRAQVAQGSAFAAAARVRAGLVVPHTEAATRVFCDMTPGDAARVTDDALPVAADDAAPAYERWRERIADAFTAPVQPQ